MRHTRLVLSSPWAGEASPEHRALRSVLVLKAWANTDRAQWLVLVYGVLIASSVVLIALFGCAVAGDGGDLGSRASPTVVGPRRKFVMVSVVLASLVSNIIFTQALFAWKLYVVALVATVAGWVAPVAISWAYFTTYAVATAPLDMARYARGRMLNAAVDWLLLFNTELVPALPWLLDRESLEAAYGFPTPHAARVSIALFASRQTALLGMATVVALFRRRWNVIALGCFVINILEIVLVLRQRWCYSPRSVVLKEDDGDAHARYLTTDAADGEGDSQPSSPRALAMMHQHAYLRSETSTNSGLIFPEEDEACKPAAAEVQEVKVDVETPAETSTHCLSSDYLTFPTMSHPRALSLVVGTHVGLRSVDDEGWAEIVTVDGAAGYVPSDILQEVPAEQRLPMRPRPSLGKSRSFVVRALKQINKKSSSILSVGGSSRTLMASSRSLAAADVATNAN